MLKLRESVNKQLQVLEEDSVPMAHQGLLGPTSLEAFFVATYA